MLCELSSVRTSSWAALALAQCQALAVPWGVFLGSAPHPAASHRVH